VNTRKIWLRSGTFALALPLYAAITWAQDTGVSQTPTVNEGSPTTSGDLTALGADDQIRYWSVILKPLINSSSSKVLLGRLADLVQKGDKTQIDALLTEAIDAGTIASLVIDKAQELSLRTFIQQLTDNGELEIPVRLGDLTDQDKAINSRVSELERALSNAQHDTEAAHQELELSKEQLSRAFNIHARANEKAAELQGALSASTAQTKRLSQELSALRAQLAAIKKDSQFIPATQVFKAPLFLDVRAFERASIGSDLDGFSRMPDSTLLKEPALPLATGSLDGTLKSEKKIEAIVPSIRKAQVPTQLEPRSRRSVDKGLARNGDRPVRAAKEADNSARTRAVQLPSILRPDGITW
jgi:hypothetical protein